MIEILKCIFIKHFLNKPRSVYSKQRYNTPVFILSEMLKAFHRHNVLGLSASLSFYAMFALIPLILLMFFLLSHLVFSSDSAIVQLAILTSNLAPKFSQEIMMEVYQAAQQKAAWGAAGLFVLFWAVTPLAAAMRACFYNIVALVEKPSFIQNKIKDMLAVIGMMTLFILFTFAGIMLEKVVTFLGAHSQLLQNDTITTIASLLITTLLIGLFYWAFFPVRLNVRHILIGAFFTALIWLMMRPAFNLFLSHNTSYGAMFGNLKNLFISITWLYFNFIVFLLGTELITALRKEDALLLKGLFNASRFPLLGGENASHLKQSNTHLLIDNYIEKLMQRYGQVFQKHEFLFKMGQEAHHIYFIVSGDVQLLQQQKIIRVVSAGEYLGEMALLSNSPTIADACVISEQAQILLISPDILETLLLDDPKIAMRFLRQMATKFQTRNQIMV